MMIIIMKSNVENLIIRNIDVSLARAFVATAETGSMTAAAHLLNLTQGAISQQVKRLEELFGKQLFDRDHRTLSLTATGDRFLLHARRLISMNDEIWGLMSAPEFEGTVRLGVPRDIIRPFIPPILRSFGDAWPRVKVELVCKSTPILREALRKGEIDITLTTEIDTPPAAERLLSEDLVWISGRSGRSHTKTPLPITITDDTCTFRSAMLRALELAGKDWQLVGPVGTNDALLATVEADLALGSLLRSTVPDHIDILPPDDTLPPLEPFHINLYTRTSQSNPVVTQLADHIRDQFARRFRAGLPALQRKAS